MFFSHVCDSVHREGVFVPACTTGHMTGVSVQGGPCPGGSLSRGLSVQGVSVWGSLSRGSLSRGFLSRGSLSRGYLSGGLCPGCLCPGQSLSRAVSVQGVSVQGDPPTETLPLYGNARAVRILLECLLWLKLFFKIIRFSSAEGTFWKKYESKY